MFARKILSSKSSKKVFVSQSEVQIDHGWCSGTGDARGHHLESWLEGHRHRQNWEQQQWNGSNSVVSSPLRTAVTLVNEMNSDKEDENRATALKLRDICNQRVNNDDMVMLEFFDPEFPEVDADTVFCVPSSESTIRIGNK